MINQDSLGTSDQKPDDSIKYLHSVVGKERTVKSTMGIEISDSSWMCWYSLRLPDGYAFRQQVAELKEKEYEALRTFLRDVENHERIRRMRANRSSTNSNDPGFVFFKEVMEKVQERDGGATIHWVLKGYAEEWHGSMRARPTS